MSCPVKFFDSTMQGAPQLTADWGAMTALLDACLVNGFNLKSVTGLTSTGGIATANISAGHLYRVDQVLTMAGANESAYNGEVRVLSVTSNTFTYAIDGTPTSPATGTISAKAAPLGFEIAYTGTNKRAYRSKNVESNRPYLRVDDSLDPLYTTTYAKYAKVTMAQGMSDIDTFVGARAPYDSAAPTKNETATGSGSSVVNGWYKWYYARLAVGSNGTDATAPTAYSRPWVLIGDDRGFYLFNDVSGTAIGGRCFTDFDSYRAADGFNTLLAAQAIYSAASAPVDSEGYYGAADWGARFIRTGDASGKVLMRSHLQVGNNVNVSFTSLNTNNGQVVSGYSTGVSWPNGPDYGLILHPVSLREGTNLRGKMPGMMFVHNDSPTLTHLSTIDGVSGYTGRKFLMVNASHGSGANNYSGMVAFDMTGPWR